MAKDSSKGTGAGKGGGSVANLQIGDEQIDLSESPLVYGQKDAALTGKARQTIEAFENKRVKNKIEYGLMTDADGNVIGDEVKGGKRGVRMSVRNWMQNTVMSHIHPRDNGTLGGTFSTEDIDNWAGFATGYNHITSRAAAKEGTYSISKAKGRTFKGNEMAIEYAKATAKFDSDARARYSQVVRDFREGKINVEQRFKEVQKLNNKMLVEMHNWLLSNQSTYGYTYTLERR